MDLEREWKLLDEERCSAEEDKREENN